MLLGRLCGIGLVVEAAVGEGTAEALVEEQEQERDLNAFGGEAVGVAAAVALQQAVAFEFAQIVAELVQAVGFRGELEGGEDGLVNLFGGPAADGIAAMQQHLQQADDPGVVDFDAGIADRADGDGQGDPLQQREVHMDVEALRLEAGEAVGDGLEPFAHGIEMIEAFLQAEVAQVVGAEFVAQEAGELFVLFEEGVFPVGAEDVMAVLDLIDDGGEFPAQPLVQPDAEDLADAVGRQPPQADLATALEDLVDGEVAFEDEVPAVLDLRDGVEARQVHLAAFLLGELRPEDEGPVIELFADDLPD